MASEPPVTELVRLDVDDAGVARITLDRPEAGNSLSAEMRDHLADTFDELSASLGVRAIVLTGAGDRHFCTGAGLGGAQKPEPPRPEGAPDRALGDVARLVRRGWQRLVASILDCEKPVIAAVNGTAAGGGANLVLACDLVVMAEEARLIEVFVKRGIMPDAGAAYLLPRIVGPQRAKELMFFGEALSAADCERWGIANRVVPATELQAAADELAERLAAGPSKAIAMTKWLVNRSHESSRHTAFDEEAFAQEMVTATADSAEGLAAFGERRTPGFRGW
ncbi:MAG: enoyl-CoA hydratase/isomerase family protein [Acidimicrobiia bacterium]|jgi:2-(1,2-epoxy-1,2-dihydrophenyl)acetyl-CoA isomerase